MRKCDTIKQYTNQELYMLRDGLSNLQAVRPTILSISTLNEVDMAMELIQPEVLKRSHEPADSVIREIEALIDRTTNITSEAMCAALKQCFEEYAISEGFENEI